MARTTLSAVQTIIDTDLTDTQVRAFIDDANAWVTHYLGGESLTAARLTVIEKYLAAHYVTLRDPRLRESSVEDVSDKYQRDATVTEYLRQAIAEDPTGIVKGRLLDQGSTTVVSWKTGRYADQ